jgi:hypothetical protein
VPDGQREIETVDGRPVGGPRHRRARRPSPWLRAALAGLGAVLACALVWHASAAAFTSTAQNTTDQFGAGAVTLGDDDGSGVLFSLAGIQPGDTGQKCITVTYGGSLPTAAVRMYVSSLAGTLGPYLTVTVEQGTGGSYATCTGFAVETGSTMTLSALAAGYTSYGTGFGAWAPTSAGQSRTYRIGWSVAADNNAAGRSAGLSLTWEAQNS